MLKNEEFMDQIESIEEVRNMLVSEFEALDLYMATAEKDLIEYQKGKIVGLAYAWSVAGYLNTDDLMIIWKDPRINMPKSPLNYERS